MSKSKVKSLSETEILELEELCHFVRFYKRCKILLFSNLGFQSNEVAVMLNCHINTVYNYIRRWNHSKFEGIKVVVEEKSKTPQVIYWEEKIVDVVSRDPRDLRLGFATWGVKRLWKYLRDRGCPFGHERVRKGMKKAGYKYRRTKKRPFVQHPNYAERKVKVQEAYRDKDEGHLVLVLDQKVFVANVGVKGQQWSTSTPSIPSYQMLTGKAYMLGIYDVKRDIIHHTWIKDLKGISIMHGFTTIYRSLPSHKRCTVIMDNYMGNRWGNFQRSLRRKNVKVCWLPAWSPHLSLIEPRFSLVKAEAIVSRIIDSVRALKMHVTRWMKYYNGERKELYPKPKYALG